MLFPLEEKFAQSVCFLLVDLYLLTFQPEKGLHLLTVLDKLSVQGSNKNGKGEVDTNTVCVIKTGMCTTKANPLVCTFKSPRAALQTPAAAYRILPDNLFCANSQTFISASVVARDFTPEI